MKVRSHISPYPLCPIRRICRRMSNFGDFNGKFKPVNLYKLRHMTGQSFKVSYGQVSSIGIEKGELRIQKSHGHY